MAGGRFDADTIDKSWFRATGYVGGDWAYCECQRVSHGHDRPCGKRVAWRNRGRLTCPGCWEANHRTRVEHGGDDSTGNCEIVCWDCHSRMM